VTEKDPEYIASFDDLVERCLLRICGPARDHFIDPSEKMPKLMRLTNCASETAIRQSLRRLTKSGRITRETRRFAGRTIRGIVCVPIRARARREELTPEDRRWLRSIGVAVDGEETCAETFSDVSTLQA
jgi:hypothetical protein